MWFKNTLILLLLIMSSTNSVIATNYTLPPDFTKEVPTIGVDSTMPTIMPPPAIIAPVIPKTKKIATSFELVLQSHSDHYRIGDTISFSIKSSQRCYLTVLNIGTTGKITVLFPNAFKQNNQIVENTMYSLPSEELMPVESLHIGKPDNSITDHETIIAVCRKSKKPLFKQPYRFNDYNFRTFSLSEDWENQMTTVDKNQEARTEIHFTAKPQKN